MEVPSRNSATYRIEARSLGSTSLVIAISKNGFMSDMEDASVNDMDDDFEVERYPVLSNAVEIQV